MKYCLTARIDPAKQFLHVSGRIEDPESGLFYLNENFTLLYAGSNGKAVSAVMERDKPHPAFDTVSRPVLFHTDGDDIEFEYEGYIPEKIADVRTNDWINEGGAEFSAFSAARRLYGEEYGKQQTEKYLKGIREAGGGASIAETGPDSPDRYVNHYFKTTVMYLAAQREFGEERLFGLLKKVFEAYRESRDATTEKFLALCDGDMRAFFEKYLFTTDWDI